MEPYLLLLVMFGAAYALKQREQQRRIALLGGHLKDYRIEKLIEQLADGYLRALGEADPERQRQIWALMDSAEQEFVDQLRRFAADIADADPVALQVSKFAWSLPLLERIFPDRSFDLRKAVAIHARGIASVARNERGLGSKEKAFTLTAEMYLLQHTCHWFCRSKAVASARLVARHRTSYAQVLGAVSTETRTAYLALTSG